MIPLFFFVVERARHPAPAKPDDPGPKQRLARGALAVAAVLPLCGCSLFAPALPAGPRGMLTALPSDVPRQEGAAPASATLLVAAPHTHRAYDTTQMAYSPRQHEIAYYRDHEWAATPSDMLQPLLLSALERTHRFAAVLGSPYVGRSTYVLQTQVGELVQDFTAPAAALRLSLHVQLTHNVTRHAVSKEIVVSEPMAQRSPEAGIAAANRAVAQALREVARFVVDNARD